MRKQRIIFIGYWGIRDGLTKATILPWLKVMQESEAVEQVVFCSIEREGNLSSGEVLPTEYSKVRHHPFFPDVNGIALLTKISDFLKFPKAIASLASETKATALFSHGAPAGALAYRVWKKTGLPFYVSSFEPHANYMLESRVWKKHGLKYNFQKYWERQQENYASGLMPVSEKYRQALLKRGLSPDKVVTVPSPVAVATFKYSPEMRIATRVELGWEENLIGIYIGKYGGLYLESEAFEIYAQCFKLIPDFRLIILTPGKADEVYTYLSAQSINPAHVLVKSVAYEEVPRYLSAADFAFATYKPGPSKIATSPVKVGEYWANGLPVLLTEGVGDESDIMMQEGGGGALFTPGKQDSLKKAIHQILSTLKEPQHRSHIPQLVKKYRPANCMNEAFLHFFASNKRGEGKV